MLTPADMPPAAGVTLINVAEAAELLGLRPRTVYDLARAGTLPHYRPAPGAVRFALADIEAHLAACRSTGTKPAPAGGMSSAALLTDADAALQSYFRQRGRGSRQKPTPASATPTSTPLRLVP
jgi:excisionase family DNA binding protein